MSINYTILSGFCWRKDYFPSFSILPQGSMENGLKWGKGKKGNKEESQKTFEVQWEMTSSTREDKNWGPEKRVKLRDTKKIKSARLADRPDIKSKNKVEIWGSQSFFLKIGK